MSSAHGYLVLSMSDDESVASEALHSPPSSSGISPDVRQLSMLDEQEEADDDEEAVEFAKESTGPRSSPTASSSSSSHSEDVLSQVEHIKELMRQKATSIPDSYSPVPAASAPPASSTGPGASAQTPARKPPAEQVARILDLVEQAFQDKAPRTDLPWPKHPVSLPTAFVSIALPVAETLRSLKPSIRSHASQDFSALLSQAAKLLNINDTTRLEAAMLTLPQPPSRWSIQARLEHRRLGRAVPTMVGGEQSTHARGPRPL